MGPKGFMGPEGFPGKPVRYLFNSTVHQSLMYQLII